MIDVSEKCLPGRGAASSIRIACTYISGIHCRSGLLARDLQEEGGQAVDYTHFKGDTPRLNGAYNTLSPIIVRRVENDLEGNLLLVRINTKVATAPEVALIGAGGRGAHDLFVKRTFQFPHVRSALAREILEILEFLMLCRARASTSGRPLVFRRGECER